MSDRQAPVGSRSNRAAVVILCALGAAASAAIAQSSTGPTENRGSSVPAAVDVVRVRSTTIVQNLNVSGSIVPRREISIGSEASGLRVKEVLVEEGDEVKTDDLLATLDTTLLDIQLRHDQASRLKALAAIAQQEAANRETDANLLLAEADYRRAESVARSGAITAQLLDQRRASFDALEARRAAGESALAAARADAEVIAAQGEELSFRVERTVLRAPTPGTISRRNIEPGALVPNTSEPLFRIIEGGELELSAEVPDLDLVHQLRGKTAAIVVSGGTKLQGTVRSVAPTVDSRSRLGRVLIALPTSPHVRPGMYAQATVQMGAKQALVVPLSAVLMDGVAASVLTYVDGQARRRVVALGEITPEGITVTNGLRQGEPIILASSFLSDGVAVSARLVDGRARAQP